MRKLLTLAILLAACIGLLVACNNVEETVILPAKTITVSNATELSDIKNYTGEQYKNYTFELADNIDLSNIEAWEPIGSNLADAFMGTFDGKGYTISGLKIVGLDERGNPTLTKPERIENLTSYYSAGLFGYTSSAVVKNVNLTNIDIRYYIDSDFGYTGGLVGYNVGASKFSDINVAGNINLSNIATRRPIYDETDGTQRDTLSECEANCYIGGVVGYSFGASEFSNLNSSVAISNENYYAYYETYENMHPIDKEMLKNSGGTFEEGYVVRTHRGVSHYQELPSQVFVGGVAGYMRLGSLVGGAYNGSVNAVGKSIYSAGLVAAVLDAKVSASTVTSANVSAAVNTKNVAAGAIALIDNSVVETLTVKGAIVNMQCSAGQSSAGGIFGYLTNLASVSECSVENLTIDTNSATSDLGGVGGDVRNGSVISSASVGAILKTSNTSATLANVKFAKVVSCVYGTSVIKVNPAASSATNVVQRTEIGNDLVYYYLDDITYVTEDGLPAIRLYEQGKTMSFVTVYATVGENVLNVWVYDEELTELAALTYSASGLVSGGNVAENNLSVYFAAEQGFKDSNEGAVNIGRDMTKYEWRAGRPQIVNLEGNNIDAEGNILG